MSEFPPMRDNKPERTANSGIDTCGASINQAPSEAESSPLPPSFLRYFGWALYPIGGLALLTSVLWESLSMKLGMGILMIAILFISVDQNTKLSSRPWKTNREIFGVMFYIIAFTVLTLAKLTFALPLAVIGFALTGLDPIRRAVDSVKEGMFSLNGERWVDFFGFMIMLIGGLILLGSLLGFVNVAVIDGHTFAVGASPKTDSALSATGIALGSFMLALGYGIRRRALWAGVLGMCFTFWAFMESLNKAFIESGGDLTRCPETLLKHSFSIMIAWGFFFGFYSVFSPLVSSRVKKVSDVLEGKLREADTALTDTRRQLDHAEDCRERTERHLDEERIKFHALYEAINEGIILFDLEDTILYMNPAYCTFYGITREEWIGQKWPPIFERPGIECLHSHRVNASAPELFREEVSKRITEGEIIIRDEKGSTRRRVAFYTKVITDAKEEFLAFMGLSRDVTLEREIDRMKTEFVSNVSHELRTPLTSIRAYTEMLLDGEADNPKTRDEYLQIILDESERLTNLINDVLDLAKMEAGKKVYKFTRNDPAKIVRKVAAVCASAAESKQLSLTIDLPAESLEALCDQELIHQAILNVTNNAIKYTPAGGSIIMRLRWENAAPLGEAYVIFVSDTGQGISSEDQKKLFDKFFRVENTLNQNISGTGLGLAIVKQIVAVHQGEVGVESEPGKGSTFTLRFPREFSQTI
ncbi:MAG: PAS domain S-box protein [Candidatus Riflebacteria bacterium]|nr:PAS domain S-box protein [Candidatus Riflebacteria bacterium]